MPEKYDPLKSAELTTEQNYNMIDGILNNGPAPVLPPEEKPLDKGREIPPMPPLSERCDTAVRQFELSAANKGEKIACLEARRHYAWYLKGVPHAGYYKEQIVKITTLEDVYRVTKGIKRDLC